MKKVRQTKQQIIDGLRKELHEAGIWAGQNDSKNQAEIKKLKQDADKAYEIERYARFDISKALGKLDDMNRCSPELNWPQIYVELGKLLQIKEDAQMKSYREKMTTTST